ncbi:hypothetical protein Shyhy01_00410 [Streptomyces hygroscopicus subsp. hygroscopicus]|uniref:hypothetical protein n=1 Tax=Streptomyces sp. KHY 26 TaxID=3097359 RepID=UPI0024A1EBB3|nr:hypothetical protein [Streptomyces hygroscopicus]GLX47091.1 hypothetical protein Shyhy01_00410 [Streptomyces hygroscopicus subsp. hygroscopicus]
MDPVSVGLLTALAGGAGGELGRQAWTGLGELVRRPFRRAGAPDGARVPDGPGDADGSGEAELARLARDPGDAAAARALSAVLAVRAAADAEFGERLRRWGESARRVSLTSGDVHNSISGGTFSAPVIQGRDVTATFGTPSADG